MKALLRLSWSELGFVYKVCLLVEMSRLTLLIFFFLRPQAECDPANGGQAWWDVSSSWGNSLWSTWGQLRIGLWLAHCTSRPHVPGWAHHAPTHLKLCPISRSGSFEGQCPGRWVLQRSEAEPEFTVTERAEISQRSYMLYWCLPANPTLLT